MHNHLLANLTKFHWKFHHLIAFYTCPVRENLSPEVPTADQLTTGQIPSTA